MRIAAIFAMSSNRVIGINNQLPWNLPADLRHFKSVTMGKPILLGRKTYLSIGRALPGRTNIVITRDLNFKVPGCMVAHTIADALLLAGSSDEVFVIGGAELYKQLLPQTDRLYMTLIHHEFKGDAFFPIFNESEWETVDRQDFNIDEENPYAYSFIILDRVTEVNKTSHLKS